MNHVTSLVAMSVWEVYNFSKVVDKAMNRLEIDMRDPESWGEYGKDVWDALDRLSNSVEELCDWIQHVEMFGGASEFGLEVEPRSADELRLGLDVACLLTDAMQDSPEGVNVVVHAFLSVYLGIPIVKVA